MPIKKDTKIKAKAKAKGVKLPNLDAFSELIEKKDIAGASKLVQGFLAKDLSSDEKLRLYSNVVSAYLDVSNEVSKHYLSELQDIITLIKTLKDEERDITEKLELAKARASLNQ